MGEVEELGRNIRALGRSLQTLEDRQTGLERHVREAMDEPRAVDSDELWRSVRELEEKVTRLVRWQESVVRLAREKLETGPA